MIDRHRDPDVPEWLQVRVRTCPGIEEAVTNYLFELGSRGCQQLDHAVVGYFGGEVSRGDIQLKLENYLRELTSLGLDPVENAVECKWIINEDWHANWKKHLKPISISERILVKPTWIKMLVKITPEIVIEIDPKQAFGTGSHATTRIALQLMEEVITGNETILDVGTGTGILAIAAAKLGAHRVLAFDKDPVAMETARENITLNSVDARIRLFVGEIESVVRVDDGFDLIVANLNRTVILKALPGFCHLLADSGQLILTGIMQEEKNTVTAEFDRTPKLTVLRIVAAEDWLGILLRKH